jgi:hypothetical protein
MKALTQLIIAILLAAASTAPLAHGRVQFGVNIGPFWGPWWAVPPPIYYSQPIVVERETPIVIEQTAEPVDYWFFCRPANTYYPYVKECPTGWERVPAQPARQP